MAATAALGARTFRALGTFATVLVTDPNALGSAHKLLTEQLAAMDAACSRFRPDSELWRVNHARGRPVTVSALFAEALAVALAAAELTHGDVDPTCGLSLVRLGYARPGHRHRAERHLGVRPGHCVCRLRAERGWLAAGCRRAGGGPMSTMALSPHPPGRPGARRVGIVRPVVRPPGAWPPGVRPTGARLPRLLAGIGDLPAGLERHDRVYGPMPGHGRGRGRPQRLIDLVEASGLTGRGGAGFPAGRKMRSVAAGPGSKVVVANGAEGEPASLKDRLLLTRLPHLVLDGMTLAAEAVGATEAYLCVHGNQESLLDRLHDAVEERRAADQDPVRIQVAGLPRRYVSSEQSSIVQYLNGGPGIPTFSPPRPQERGVNGSPTLVHNVETLAHLALIARYGDRWFRGAGLPSALGYDCAALRGECGGGSKGDHAPRRLRAGFGGRPRGGGPGRRVRLGLERHGRRRRRGRPGLVRPRPRRRGDGRADRSCPRSRRPPRAAKRRRR
jgi:Respiratory-chain NADH dehydrogenase 51 Kd subunit/ApbE family